MLLIFLFVVLWLKIKEPFWCPTIVVSGNKSSEFVLPAAAQPFNFTNSCGLRYEAAEVRRCITEGRHKSFFTVSLW